jgi:DNA polymerase I-like protein with 3'-5' exonuclease and polymerase domains
MPLLSTDELKSLIENSTSPCISIYMPMEKAGSEIRQNPIRFKNLMREAEQRLEEMGIDHNEAMTWLEQANAIDSPEFWEENHGEGWQFLSLPKSFVTTSFRLMLKNW